MRRQGEGEDEGVEQGAGESVERGVSERADEGVVVYWRPGCPYCMKLRLRLRFARLRYTEVNIWRDKEAAVFVRSVANGNETVPTVTVAGHPLINPSKRQLMEAVETYAPHLLA